MTDAGGLFVASDIGGTFTDTVTIDESGEVGRFKAATVPDDPAAGVLATLQLAADARGVELRDLVGQITQFAHGTTVATNAMIEDERATVGLLQTRGFGDTVSSMRGFKTLGLSEDEIKNFRALVKSPPAVPRQMIAEVTERVDYMGRVVIALDEDDVRRAVDALLAKGAETIAVSFLWSFKNDVHERRVGEIVEELSPGTLVTLSSEFMPRLGEFRRSATTAINASLRPTVRRAVATLADRLNEQGLHREPLLMQSNGGLARVSEIDREAAATVMSGPVGGVIACQFLGALEGRRDIVATDMGGTSFDVGLVIDGEPLVAHSTWVGRHEIALPSVNVMTVGAGSGSIAGVRNGMLTLGPESAGADPGPACYGRGGERPTVADADLVLGYLNPDNFLGGRVRLDVERARRAIEEHVATLLGMDVHEAAEGIRTVVDSRMSDLVRQVTIEQGFDPADLTLYAYGGAGPTHAASYGVDLGISEIVVPLTASVNSAFGIASSDMTTIEEVSDPIQSQPGTSDYGAALPAAEINERFASVAERAIERLVRAGVDRDSVRLSKSVEMRFRFQIHVLSVPVPEGELDAAAVDALVRRFIASYEARFGEGSAFEAAGVQMTTFRVVAQSGVPRPELRHAGSGSGNGAAPAEREIFSAGAWVSARILQGEQLAPGDSVEGMAVLEMPDTTIVVGPGQTATINDHGSVLITLPGGNHA